MKEEELIKKLESVKLPHIEVESHRYRLRMALLQSQYLERHPRGVAVLKSKMKGGVDAVEGLFSRRPVWKPALVSALAVALIAVLAVTIPPLLGQSPEVLAAEIAKNSPEVQAALGDGEVKVVVIKVVDDKGIVICQGELGIITAEVDMKTKKVTETEVVPMPELTEADMQEAINIAEADPNVQELLNKGASIGKVSPMYSFGARMNEETGEIEEFSETLARVEIGLGEKSWAAEVDFAEGKVVRLIETTPTSMESRSDPEKGNGK